MRVNVLHFWRSVVFECVIVCLPKTPCAGAFGEDPSFVIAAVMCLMCGTGVFAYERYAKRVKDRLAQARRPLFSDELL